MAAPTTTDIMSVHIAALRANTPVLVTREEHVMILDALENMTRAYDSVLKSSVAGMTAQ